MLVDKPDANERLSDATRKVARVVIPKNLDRDLPGRRVAHGFNIGLTPVVFAAIGFGIDHLVGTLPLFTLGLAVFSMIGVLVSAFYRFKAATEAEARS